MKVLSLFDGISVAQQALKELGANVEIYYASEIDKYALQVTQKNFPGTIQLGDVKNVFRDKVGKIDLLIGGSPCQDLSIAKTNRQGLAGARSGLFFEYVRILKEVKPKYFVLENVASMPKEARAEITKIMGVEPIMINAALVSAQQRKRLFWTNIPNVIQPEDMGILLKDIIEKGYVDREKSRTVATSIGRTTTREYFKKCQGQMVFIEQTPRGFNKGGIKALDGKTPTMSSSKWQDNNKLYEKGMVRKLTPIECERLQSLPDNYTEGVSNTRRYETLGNAFNCEVVKHILKNIL